MGAQAAALLDPGGPVGEVPRPAPVAGSLRLRALRAVTARRWRPAG